MKTIVFVTLLMLGFSGGTMPSAQDGRASDEAAMRESGEAPDAFFARHRHAQGAAGDMAQALAGYRTTGDPVARPVSVPSLIIDEVERIWSAIAEQDDWKPLMNEIGSIRLLGSHLGRPPPPAGHC